MKRDGSGDPDGMIRTPHWWRFMEYQPCDVFLVRNSDMSYQVTTLHVPATQTSINLYHPMMMVQNGSPPPPRYILIMYNSFHD